VGQWYACRPTLSPLDSVLVALRVPPPGTDHLSGSGRDGRPVAGAVVSWTVAGGKAGDEELVRPVLPVDSSAVWVLGTRAPTTKWLAYTSA